MKLIHRLFVALLLVAVVHSTVAQAAPPLSNFHSIATTYNAPVSWNGTGSSVPCSSTVTSYCVKDYTLSYTPPSGGTAISPINTPGTSFIFTPSGALYCGTYGISIVANWLDPNGLPATSLPLTGTVVVACPFNASPATGLKDTVN